MISNWPNRDPIDELGFTLLTTGRQPIPTVDVDDDEPGIESGSRRRSTELNLYAFVDNRPTTEIDPFGLFLGFGYGNWCGWSRWGQGGGPIDGKGSPGKQELAAINDRHGFPHSGTDTFRESNHSVRAHPIGMLLFTSASVPSEKASARNRFRSQCSPMKMRPVLLFLMCIFGCAPQKPHETS